MSSAHKHDGLEVGSSSQLEMNEAVRRSLPAVSVVLGALYLILAIIHLLLLPPAASTVLTPMAAVTSLVLFGVALLLRRRVLPLRWAHPAGASIGGLVLINSLLHLALTGELRQTTNLLLLIVGAGSLSLSTTWLAILVVVTLVGWAAVVLAHPALTVTPRSEALHFGLAMLFAVVISGLAHALRSRTLRRKQHLRRRDEERKEELQAALNAARESETRYRALLDSANDLVQSVGPDGSILYVNRAWRETLGYTEEDIADLTAFAVIHPDSRAHCKTVLRRLTEEASSERVETRFVTRDGEEIIVEGNVNCRFEDGAPVATLGIFRDVTARAGAERALQRQNRDLVARNAVARALAGSMDLQERLEEALSSAMDALGFSAGLIGLADEQSGRLELFSHAGLPASLAQSLEAQGLAGTLCDLAYQEGEPLVIEDLHEAGSKERQPGGLDHLLRLELRAYAGAPIVHRNSVLGTFCLFDRAPCNLSEADQALLTAIGQQIGVAVENTRLFRESARRYRYLEGLLSAAPDAIVTLDGQYRIAEWNAGAERMFGYSKDEVLGRDLDLLITTPDVLEEATGFTKDVMCGEKLPPVETTRYRKDGSPVNVLLAGSPIIIEGDFAGAVAVYTDIGELKKAQEALRTHAAELETRNQELDAYAHTVAHDLKNPLQLLVGYAEILGEDYESLPDGVRREVRSTIVETADRMNYIIGELLLLSEVRRGEMATEPLDMARIVEATRDRLAYMIRHHEAELVTPDDWPTAFGHAPWIEEVWANYLSNAIKYGGHPPRVEMGATRQPNGALRFWVRDNGRGLAPEEQARLFTPFTRLHHIRAEGHGLGLSIVRRIMDKLEGEVGVESDVGEGSTFYFTLPQA